MFSIDFGAIEQRIIALGAIPERRLRRMTHAMKYGIGAQKLHEYVAAQGPVSRRTQLAIDILIFERWQSEHRARIRRENAAIAYAAAEHGIVSKAPCRAAYESPTGRWSHSEPEMQLLPTEWESDMERDRR